MWRDFIKKFAEQKPDHAAVIDRVGGRTYSYAALEREIKRWARHLHRQGIAKGDRVVFLSPSRLEHITLFFACAKLGAILVPLNHRLAPRELEQILDRVEPKYFIGLGPCPVEATLAYRDIAGIDLDAEAAGTQGGG